MNAHHLVAALLRCPRCLGRLADPVADPDGSAAGTHCASCGVDYPSSAGIIRFAAESYVESFGRQWNRYDVAREEEDASVFEVKTGQPAETLRGLAVLDAGCGGGRYARLVARAGADVVGVDLSSAVEKASALCSEEPNALIVQGDLLRLPLAPESFDFAFSIGVMHHGPDVRGAFREVARRVKPGGRMAVWLYRRNTAPQEWINQALRAITTRLPAPMLEAISVALGVLGGIPVVNKTLNKVFNFSNHPDWTLRVCDNFDWYAPRYQSHHTESELRGWFEAEGFERIEALAPAKGGSFYDWAYRNNLIIGSGVNMVGVKRSRPTA
ncbi:MAG: methyltransferase domain-containing protein [Isosphaeraceae bacterium]|nr:methyltransferase domain-containing protein [Isosphaeraceae bacterium]